MEPKVDEITQELQYSENVKRKLELISKQEKSKLIRELNNGLGQKIKANSGRVIIKKKSLIQKIGIILKRFFTLY